MKTRMTLALIGVLTLTGCVTEQHHTSTANISHPAVLHPMKQAATQYQAARAEILHNQVTVQPIESRFKRAVWHLQSLGYLPITHAYIRGPNGTEHRHDAFLWPVPHALQKAVDAQAWNAQNPFIRGAIIQFERANGILKATGLSEGNLHPAVFKALISTKARKNPYPWQWVTVNKANGTNIPEQLHIWQHGKGWIWKTVVNTGVLGSTPNGTWPIYQRLPHTTMQGVFPIPVSWATYQGLAGKQVPQWGGSTLMQSARGMVNGHPVRWQPYRDPGILWVNYFNNGRGIHYYPRASYGFPQSAGCVEEPYQNAPVTYRLLHYGVPVTISPTVFHRSTHHHTV